MPVEVIGADDGVDKLNETWPDGSEPVKQGDDHLRNIKKAVKNQERLNKDSNFGIVNPNMLINGDFSVNQRGVNGAVQSTLFLADRTVHATVPGSNVTRVKEGGLTAVKVIHPSKWGLHQTIEEVRGLRVGDKLTMQIKAAGYDPSNPTLLRLATASGHSDPTDNPINGNVVIAPSGYGSLDLLTATFAVNQPVYDAIQAGAYLRASVEPNTTDFLIADFKLELGSVATPFVADDPAVNLGKCQRYYLEYTPKYGGAYVAKHGGVIADGNPDVWQQRIVTFNFPTTMRKTPAMNVVLANWASTVANDNSPYGFSWVYRTTASTAWGGLTSFTADAEL